MTSSPKEILLVGFGAIGSIYAFCLNRSALARVTVVARSNYALINDYGVHIKSRRYGDIPGWKPDRLCKSVSDAANQKYDYVIVTSKALPDIIATSTMLLPLISSSYTERFGQPTYALLQNLRSLPDIIATSTMLLPLISSSYTERFGQPTYALLQNLRSLPDIIATSTMLLPLISSSYTERFGQPTYALLQNGLDVEKDLYDSLMALGEKPKIISTSVYIMTNITAPGEVEHLSMTDPIFLGIYRHGDYTTCVNSPGETNVLEGLAVPLSCGGFQAQVVPEIQRKKLAKNMINVVFASTATLTNYTVPALFRPAPEKGSASYDPYLEPKTASSINEYTIPTLHAMLVEMVSLARALGFPDTDDGFPSSLVDETIANQRRMHEDPQNSHVPSMLLDARNGQLIEIEAIVGSVVRIAHERGVSVTRIETLYALLLVIQNQAVRRKLLSSSS